MTQVQQVVLDGAGGIVVAEAAVPAPGAGEVLIKVGATGICGTDVHLLTGHYAAGRYPLVPGARLRRSHRGCRGRGRRAARGSTRRG